MIMDGSSVVRSIDCFAALVTVPARGGKSAVSARRAECPIYGARRNVYPVREAVHRSKLRMEGRQWVMSRLLPQQWGEKQQIDVKNNKYFGAAGAAPAWRGSPAAAARVAKAEPGRRQSPDAARRPGRLCRRRQGPGWWEASAESTPPARSAEPRIMSRVSRKSTVVISSLGNHAAGGTRV
jgi:hypothetical protein